MTFLVLSHHHSYVAAFWLGLDIMSEICKVRSPKDLRKIGMGIETVSLEASSFFSEAVEPRLSAMLWIRSL